MDSNYQTKDKITKSIDTPSKNKTNMFINVIRDKEDIEKTINFLKKELIKIEKGE